MKKIILSLFTSGLLITLVQAQVNVSVDVEELRYLGATSELDRSKFFTFHSVAKNDSQIASFKASYDVKFGRRFWGPFADVNDKYGQGNYPAYTSGTTDSSVREVSRFVATGAPSIVMRYNASIEDAANWAIEYWLDEVGTDARPEFWEPMNEPFVHAGDAVFSQDQSDVVLVRERMIEWYNTLALKVKQTPELANMKMIGYSSAWPSMELWDFGHWNGRMKKFIDMAGANMDAISVHPYDGVNITGQNNSRSGSNSEAILDLIESYTAEKFGTPKDLAITEYGIIEEGYPDTYTETESAISIRGINHMLFNFLERQDNIAITIPFITDKSDWHYNIPRTKPYVPGLFRPLVLSPASNWVYSYKIYFFKIWEDVKGMRTHIQSDNPDIQVQSFVDVDKVYIALNNLDDANQAINLNLLSGTTGISQVKTKSLKIYFDQSPSYTVTTGTTLPSNLSLDPGETVLLELTYSTPVPATKKITRTKYYGQVTSTAGDPTFSINANVSNTFQFTGVNTATDGFANLRVGIGRDHSFVKLPSEILVNGTSVAVPTNWGGYDQANRDEFFGVIVVPFDISLLNSGTNTVSVKFPDTGGKMSSLILSVEARDSNCVNTWYEDADLDGLGDPAVSQTSCARPDGYVDNADDTDPNTISANSIKIIPVPGRLQAQDFNVNSGVQLYTINDSETGGEFIGSLQDGDFAQYKLKVDQSSTYNVSLRVASNSTGGTITVMNRDESLGSVNVTNTGGWRTFETITMTLNLEKGIQNLRLNFSGPDELLNLNWLDFEVGTPLSVPDFSSIGLEVYPNPAKDKLVISGLKQARTFTILELTGRKVLIFNLDDSNSTIDISSLSNGLYLITEKQTGSSYKFIKQ